MTTATEIKLAGRVFTSPEELKAYVQEQSDIVKQGRSLLKQNKPAREPSVKSSVAKEIVQLLNTDATVLEMCQGVSASFRMSLLWNVDSKTFTVPKLNRVREPGNNSVHMGAKSLTVDGTEYKSASAAIHAICPETVGKPMGREPIVKYLRHVDHGSHNVQD